MTSAAIHQLAKLTGLKADLKSAFADRVVLSSEWLSSIDPESMQQLKDIWGVVAGTYSLVGLAIDIVQGKELKLT